MKTERKSWAARAQALLDEQAAERLRPAERVQERLRWEDWEALRNEAVAFAAKEIGRRKWRGARDGVLPGGLGAEDVADQAISEMLSGKCRLAPGWVRSRLVGELERLVSQKVRLLHRLKEAPGMRSEWDIAGPDEDGKLVSIFEGMQDAGADVREAAAEQEEEGERRKTHGAFEEWLGPGELRWVFRCMRAGVNKPMEIARLLAIEESEVARLRKKLERRIAKFGRAVGRREWKSEIRGRLQN